MRLATSFLTVGITLGAGSLVAAQTATGSAGFYTDPATGIVYRQVVRTVQTPIVETKMTPQEQTVYTPETVVETRPEVRRTYVPVTQYRLTPQVEGRWNPFVEPRVAYQHVPETTWQARDEVVQQTQTRVQWKAEKKVTQIAQQVTRFDSQQKIDYEPVGRVAVPPAANVDPQIAARLRPLASTQAVAPLGGLAAQAGTGNFATLAPDDNNRNAVQSGLRPTDLIPNAPLPMTPSNVAGLPGQSIWR